jgi:hypothetical protein
VLIRIVFQRHGVSINANDQDIPSLSKEDFYNQCKYFTLASFLYRMASIDS